LADNKAKGGLLFGALVGAAIGFLFAPRTGKETRERLFGEEGIMAQERLRGALGAGVETASERSEALRQKIEETRNKLREQAVEDEAVEGED